MKDMGYFKEMCGVLMTSLEFSEITKLKLDPSLEFSEITKLKLDPYYPANVKVYFVVICRYIFLDVCEYLS